MPQATLAIGANNVFDIYPNKVPLVGTDGTTAVLATNGGVAFPFFSPFGFNGRYLFAKLNLKAPETYADLEKLLGRGVDLVEPGAVRNPYVLASINRNREAVYAA